MGKEDDALSFYLSIPEHFADLWNGGLYNGNQVVLSDELYEVQRAYHVLMRDRNDKACKSNRKRDVIRAFRRNGEFVILAVENQDMINYCMPLRLMEYDVNELNRQLKQLRRYYQENGGLETGEEYLSKMKANDRIIPVLTIVFYHGKGRWNGPFNLKDLFKLDALDDKMKECLSDYKTNVLNVADLDENNFRTGLRKLIGMLKRRENKEALRQFCSENEERFREMDDETYDVICTMMNMDSLVKSKESYRNAPKKGVNMCKAFEDWAKEEQEKGRKLGEKNGEKRMADLISRLLDDGKLDEVKAVANNLRVRNRMYQEYGI